VSKESLKPPAKRAADPSAKPAAPDAGANAGAHAGAKSGAAKSTGRVKFDERGTAVWEWSIATGAFGREVTTERLQKLEHPAMSLADDATTPFETVRSNPLGTKKGYDPYDSGKLGKRPEAAKKKDLRRLSEFLKLKKQAEGNKDD
jgi:hypothetical protein